MPMPALALSWFHHEIPNPNLLIFKHDPIADWAELQFTDVLTRHFLFSQNC
jgi:hypothetical protein